MRKNKLFGFLLALVVLMIALPTEAQSRRRSRNGNSRSNRQDSSQYRTGRSDVPYDASNARYGYDTPDRGYRQASQRNVNADIAVGGLNLLATAGGTWWNRRNENKHHEQQMAAIESLRQVQQAPQQYPARTRQYENSPQEAELQVEVEQPHAPPLQYQPKTYRKVAQEYATVTIVTNRTGECIEVDGKRVDNHDTLQVSDIRAMRVGPLQGSTCTVHAYKTESVPGQRTYDLVCGR